MRRLPPRSVSAYEVFVAEQLEEKSGGQMIESAGAGEHLHSCRASIVSVRSDASAAANGEGTAHVQDAASTASDRHQQQRAAAVAWLRLTTQEKQRYEDVAQKWSATQRQTLQEDACNMGADRAAATAVVAASTSCSQVNDVTPSAEAQATAAAAGTLKPSSSFLTASLSQQASLVLPSPPPPPPPPFSPAVSSSTAKSAKRASQKATSAKAFGRRLTSFDLFRSTLRGKKWTVAKATACWEGMSAEEKACYDAAAAAFRTEGFLPSPLLSSSPSSLSLPTPLTGPAERS